MADMISGPGQGLPAPQALYPRMLWTSPFTAPSNRVMLQAGQSIMIPAGTWITHAGTNAATVVLMLEWLDPVTREWFALSPLGTNQYWGQTVRSDGFNFRIANFSGVANHAVVTAGGDDYNQATTEVHPSTGDSRWRVLVGGAVGPITIEKEGENYSIPPQVFIPAPPSPGIAALAHAVLTDGKVTGIVVDIPGAGYTFAPPVLIVPDPFDPVLLAAAEDHRMTARDVIKNATARSSLTAGKSVTAVLLERAGIPLATAPNLIISGQGTGASASVTPSPFIAPTNEFAVIQPASGP